VAATAAAGADADPGVAPLHAIPPARAIAIPSLADTPIAGAPA